MDDLARFITDHAGEPESGLAELARFNAAYRESLERDYDWSSPAAAFLRHIFGNSHALAERLIAHPEWADEHAHDPFIALAKPRAALARDLDRLLRDAGNDSAAVGKALRHFKYRELTRIVARDLAGGAGTEELLREWSCVADLAIDAAYTAVRSSLVDKYGESCAGSIIALGKLGGNELNISSDVDLLFIYASDDNGGASLTPHEFYVKLASDVTRMLSRTSADGFVFRVDHELRPEGTHGALANSIEAIESYYGYFGSEWERQALIRARHVAGDSHLGQQFLKVIGPLVFKKSLSFDDLKAVQRIKERTAKAFKRRDVIDVKHGDGGIRSVEFLVQALQLIYGGRIEKLREPNVFRIVDTLIEERLIHPTSGARLGDAYSFLRRTENMLQMVREQQTHHIPKKVKDVEALARRLGYGGSGEEREGAFRRDLAHHMSNVQRLFEGMFEFDYERVELIEAIDANLATCTNEEERCDSIPWFKLGEARRVQHLDLEGKLTLPEVFSRLTLVAEVVIATARKLAWQPLVERYGIPREADGRQASFAIIGMGKLGSKEVDYGSDLDLCFIYSGEGRTDGDTPVDNGEFFARLVRRIISIISTTSRYGKAYEVDPALRPSGGAGTLVSTQSSFMDYHLSHAEPWERLALQRARVIDGDQLFMGQLQLMLNSLAYELPPPPGEKAREQLRHIRKRVAREMAREGKERYSIKHGRGGSDDLDSVLQYLQLMNAGTHHALRVNNTFALAGALHDEGMLNDDAYEDVMQAMMFYRRTLSLLRLLSGRSTADLDMNSPHARIIAQQMGLSDTAELAAKMEYHRERVWKLFTTIVGEDTTKPIDEHRRA